MRSEASAEEAASLERLGREHRADRFHDECGVVGVLRAPTRPRTIAYLGLYALQHRGQESCGHRGTSQRAASTSCTARWGSSPRSSTRTDALTAAGPARDRPRALLDEPARAGPPRTRSRSARTTDGGPVAIAHNGNLVNARAVRKRARGARRDLQHRRPTARSMLHLLARSRESDCSRIGSSTRSRA